MMEINGLKPVYFFFNLMYSVEFVTSLGALGDA
jgi:hypothetical protein